MSKYFNSYDIYKQIAVAGKNYQQSTAGIGKISYGRNIIPSKPNFEQAYFDILKTLLYELVIFRKSELIALFCFMHNVNPDFSYIEKIKVPDPAGSVYDGLFIVGGLHKMLCGETENMVSASMFLPKDKFIFQGFKYNQDHEPAKQQEFLAAVTALDNLLLKGFRHAAAPEVYILKNDLPSVDAEEHRDLHDSGKEQRQSLMLYEFKTILSNRKESEDVLLGGMQRLQQCMQEELKEIIALRDAVKYNCFIESISQLVAIFNLIHDVYAYHSKTRTTSQNYKVLIDNCLEFLEAVRQSLLYLGLVLIEKTEVVFDPRIHEVDGNAVRGSMVASITRIGFAYHDRVIQKARVLLRN